MQLQGEQLIEVLYRCDPAKRIGLRGPDDLRDISYVTVETAIALATKPDMRECCDRKQCKFCGGEGSFETGVLWTGTGNLRRIHFLQKGREWWPLHARISDSPDRGPDMARKGCYADRPATAESVRGTVSLGGSR